MKKNLLKIVLTLGMLTTIQAHLSARTFYASPAGTQNGLSYSTPSSLTNAINILAKSNGDTVVLASGTYIIATQLATQAEITILGAGSSATIIDAGSSYSTAAHNDISILKIGYNCNISNLSIRNSHQTRYKSLGGGIYIHGNNQLDVKLEDVNISGCSAEYGSGVYAENATINIFNSNFSSNSFHNGLNGYGGAIYLENCNTQISYSSFTGNKAKKGAGIYSVGGELRLENSTIENNGTDPGTDPGYEGGGIYLQSTNANIFDTKISNNLSYAGAGIYAQSQGNSSLELSNCNIYKNSTAPVNGEQGIGGGLYLKSYASNLINCNIADNTAGLKAGAVYSCGKILELNHCTVSYNTKTVNWSIGTAGIEIDCSGIAKISNSILSGDVNTQEAWSQAPADLNLDASNPLIIVSNTIIGANIYDNNENINPNLQFHSVKHLSSVDANGFVSVTDSRFSSFGANPEVIPSFITQPASYSCSGYELNYVTQSGQNSYIWTISGTENVDYQITSGSTNSPSIGLTWLSGGNKTVTVNYKNALGIEGIAPALAYTRITVSPTIIKTISDTICKSGTVKLSANSSSGSIKWYTTPTGGNSINTGTNYSPTISASTIFYVDATNNGCTTPSRVPVAGIIAATNISDKALNICSGTMFNFTPIDGLDGNVSPGTVYSWPKPSATDINGSSAGNKENSISNKLTNSSSVSKSIIYNITPTTGTCVGKTFNLTVNVNPSPIISVNAVSVCKGKSAIISPSANINNSTFYWYDSPTNGKLLYSGTNFNTGIISADTVFYVEAEYNGCTSSPRTAVPVSITSVHTDWIGTTDSDWENPTNWTNGVPSKCSSVTIKQSPQYPNISNLNNASCRRISFEPETSIYGLENLTYDSAIVQVNLKRNKWYMLTSPLKEMYSGDYYFEGKPVTQMKLFGINYSASDGTHIQTITGNWTNSFASLKEKLSPGEGFAYRIEQTEWHYPTGYSAIMTDKKISFPQTNADGSLKKTAIPYNSITGKPYPTLAQTMAKDDTKAYRFAMENAANKLSSISIPVKKGLNLIGNPLMSHLDFVSLYKSNQSLIKDYVQFWNGSGFGSITSSGTTSGASVEGLSLKIPPMKSFVIDAIQDGNLIISLNNYTPKEDVSLKSASIPENTVYIELDNGHEKNSCAVLMNPQAENNKDLNDVGKLFSMLNNVPEVYTITDKYALDINQFKNLPYTAAIGVHAGGTQSVNFHFNGVESFKNTSVRLINTANNEIQDLNENPFYTLETNGTNSEGILFLEFRSTDIPTKVNTSNLNDIEIITTPNKHINILSSKENRVLQIYVYDPLGKLVCEKTANISTMESISVNHSGNMFIVKVISENGIKTKKIVLSN